MMNRKEAENENRKGEESVQSQSLLGSVIGGLRRVAAGVFGSSANFLLSWFSSKVGLGGGALQSSDNKTGKRKRLGETRGEGDDEGNDDVEFDQKRWRPDTVYESVQQFINNLLVGEKDTKHGQDENMNTSSFTYNNIGQQNWNKRPDINFFSDSHVSSIHDIELEGDIKTTSTPQIFIEEEESGPNVFIFSAEKSGSPTKNELDDNSLSRSTFEEKQAYFLDQIKMQEIKAKESQRRSPSPLPLAASQMTKDD